MTLLKGEVLKKLGSVKKQSSKELLFPQFIFFNDETRTLRVMH